MAARTLKQTLALQTSAAMLRRRHRLREAQRVAVLPPRAPSATSRARARAGARARRGAPARRCAASAERAAAHHCGTNQTQARGNARCTRSFRRFVSSKSPVFPSAPRGGRRRGFVVRRPLPRPACATRATPSFGSGALGCSPLPSIPAPSKVPPLQWTD
ncbi:MAG: hypothetical protein J3K34DRAFT_431633 [Monoraphidium minutum]|nr:MAG: hypothetical protein J3K34DRAFT_431633 [Monoraphidium minutum]